MVEPVLLDGLVVEPRAIARFPLAPANHAEFCGAATRHMVATLLELDGGFAIEAALPSLFLRDLDEFRRGGVFRACAAGVPFAVAGAADFGFAAGAFAVLAAAVDAAGEVGVDV